MKRLVVLLAVLMTVGCKTASLETGGSYAPTATTANMPLYQADAAYKIAYDAMNAAFQFEYDNRTVLWKIAPEIKTTMDKIRPQAWAANLQWVAARKVYEANPTVEGLKGIQAILANMQTFSVAVQAAITAGGIK